MSLLFNQIPASVVPEIKVLNDVLDEKIPAKSETNLLIATWNIRCFGDLTLKWTAGPGDSPQRDMQSLYSIIQVIKRFDIIAVQEVKNNIKCLRETMKYLGDDWSFLMTDVTRGNPGNSERLAFIFNNTKAKLSGLACEIVVPDEQLKKNISTDALIRQFARTPYAVSFKVNDQTFVLLTLHVLYGKNSADRIAELRLIAEWIYDWAKQLNRWGHSLITLGDFNIDREGDEAYQAFVSKNLFIPPGIRALPKTIFKEVKHYDQIGWFKNTNSKSQINLVYKTGGIFDFRNTMLISRNLSLTKLSHRISDHFPLWVEFAV